jgi:hypothetical protein
MSITISTATFEAARELFEERGTYGCEGTAMIAADGTATRLVVPDQEATPVPHCTVTVTTAGKLALAAALGRNERYIARIHSHPGLAFHSPTDDANPAITFEGALSIVVPYFGLGLRHGLDACAVLQIRSGRWVDLPAGPGRNRELRVG